MYGSDYPTEHAGATTICHDHGPVKTTDNNGQCSISSLVEEYDE